MNNTIEMMKKYKIHATKSLGQNFLIDDQIVSGIVDAAELTQNDLVIEVGPGTGSLTRALVENAGYVVAVEIDRQLIPVLKNNFREFSNIHIIHKDILKVDIKEEILRVAIEAMRDFKPTCIKVIANLPYYITTPIIMKFLEELTYHEMEDGFPSLQSMIFMIQKEVADRIIASPGGKDYGALTVAVQFFSHPQRVLSVPPECFIPRPAVDSSVIKLEVYKEPPVKVINQEIFFKTVKAAFGQRRKTLLNALTNSGYFKVGKEYIRGLLQQLDIDENRRGETLSIEQFAQLSDLFSNKAD